MCAALAVVVVAPAVSSASLQQEVQTITRLAADVNSADPKVRRAALKALATRGPEAIEPLSLLVGDPERDIRSGAIDAIVAIYVEPPPRSRVSSAEDAFGWTQYRTTPWTVPPALLTNLVRALADDWPSVRRDAAYTLGVVMTPPIDDRVADELIYSLADADNSVRLAAARSLGRLRATRAGDHLIGRIVDPDLPVRLAAMRAVGEIREARALVALQEQLDYYRGGIAGRTRASPGSAGFRPPTLWQRSSCCSRNAIRRCSRPWRSPWPPRESRTWNAWSWPSPIPIRPIRRSITSSSWAPRSRQRSCLT
jgi:HEAT repeat protein